MWFQQIPLNGEKINIKTIIIRLGGHIRSIQFSAEKGPLDHFICYIPVCAEANDLCFTEVQIEFGQIISS